MSYSDDVKIFLNLMAQSPDGLNDPKLISKFSQAKAMLHGLQSQGELQAQQITPPVMPQQAPVGNVGQQIAPQPTQSTPQGEMVTDGM